MTLFQRIILFGLTHWPRLFSWFARREIKRQVKQAVKIMPRVSRQQARIMRQAALDQLVYHDAISQENIAMFRSMAYARRIDL